MFHTVSTPATYHSCVHWKSLMKQLKGGIFCIWPWSNIQYSWLLNSTQLTLIFTEKNWQFLASKVEFQGFSQHPPRWAAPTEAGIISCFSIYTFLYIWSSASSTSKHWKGSKSFTSLSKGVRHIVLPKTFLFCNSLPQDLSRVISIFMGEWAWRILFSLARGWLLSPNGLFVEIHDNWKILDVLGIYQFTNTRWPLSSNRLFLDIHDHWSVKDPRLLARGILPVHWLWVQSDRSLPLSLRNPD